MQYTVKPLRGLLLFVLSANNLSSSLVSRVIQRPPRCPCGELADKRSFEGIEHEDQCHCLAVLYRSMALW